MNLIEKSLDNKYAEMVARIQSLPPNEENFGWLIKLTKAGTEHPDLKLPGMIAGPRLKTLSTKTLIPHLGDGFVYI